MSGYTELEVKALNRLFGGHICIQRDLLLWRYASEAFIAGREHLRLGTLSELRKSHRRWILDFPLAKTRDQRLQELSSLTIAELWAKANATPGNLTGAEADFLIDRYWPDLEAEERLRKAKATSDFRRGHLSDSTGLVTWDIAQGRAEALHSQLVELREALCSGEETQALLKAEEVWGERRREERARRACSRCTRPWMSRWYAECAEDHKKEWWGYMIFCDKAAQELLTGGELEVGSRTFAVRRKVEAVNMARLSRLGAEIMQERLNFQWETPQDAPEVVDTDTIDWGEDTDPRILRREWPRYNASLNETAIGHFRDVFRTKKISDQLQGGILENTFLVVDPTCVHSVIQEGTFSEDGTKGEWHGRPLYYQGWRVLAVDAEYPVSGKAYAEGYKGYVWVRLNQLCDEFYEQRWQHPEIGMDLMWKAAQNRKHQAFEGMNPSGEQSPSSSQGLRGLQNLT